MSGLTAYQKQSKQYFYVGTALSLPAFIDHSIAGSSLQSNPSFPTFMHAQPFQELTFPPPISKRASYENQDA